MISTSAIVLWLGTAAQAADVAAVSVDGGLRPGRPGLVEIAVVADAAPVRERPLLEAVHGRWMPVGDERAPGVWAWVVTPEPGLAEVEARVGTPSGPVPVELVVMPEPAPDLMVSARPHLTGDRVLRAMVTGDDLPPPDQLQVSVSEGRVVGVADDDGALVVSVAPDPEVDAARHVLVAVRDLRRDAPPAFGTIRVRALRQWALETLPGATVRLDVGGRRYGPVQATDDGRVSLPVELDPWDAGGRATITSPSGAEGTQDLSLARGGTPVLHTFVSGPLVPGGAPPDVVLQAIDVQGRPWRDAAPACRDLRGRELLVTPLGPGRWRAALPVGLPDGAWDLRLRCDLGRDVGTVVAVPLAEGVPTGLAVRIWPDELSTDLPVADVQVALRNALGERMGFVGRAELEADLGVIASTSHDGPAVRAEYRGDVAAEVGEDVIHVRWFARPGAGPPASLRVAPGSAGDGRARLHVRALDGARRPLPGVDLDVVVGDRTIGVTTGPDGWATATPPWDGAARPLRVLVRSAHREQVALVVPGHPSGQGPGAPDLVEDLVVTVDPGRVADVALVVTPFEIRPGPRSTALVRAELTDRSGLPADDADPEITATAGTLTSLGQAEDGAFEWSWAPPGGFRERSVEIAVREEDLDLEDRVMVRVRPKPVSRLLGISGGVHSNFGAVLSPTGQLDLAWRIRVGPRREDPLPGRLRLMVRASAGWFYASNRSDDEAVAGTIRMDVIPITLGLSLRQDWGSMSLTGGVGGILAPYVGASRFDDVLVQQKAGVLPPGFAGWLAYGVRVPGGEIVLELRGMTLSSPGNAWSLQGQIGGLSGSLGYRVAY